MYLFLNIIYFEWIEDKVKLFVNVDLWWKLYGMIIILYIVFSCVFFFYNIWMIFSVFIIFNIYGLLLFIVVEFNLI